VIEYLPPIAPGLDRAAFVEKLQNTIEAACASLNSEAIGRDPSLKALVAEGARYDAAIDHSA
jgi:hypothetical protein